MLLKVRGRPPPSAGRLFALARPRSSPVARTSTFCSSVTVAQSCPARARRCRGCRRDRRAAACRPASPTGRPGCVSARCPFCTAAESRRAVADFCSSKSRPQERLPLRDLLGHRAADDLVLLALADRRLVHVGLGNLALREVGLGQTRARRGCPRRRPGSSPSGRPRPPPAGCASRAIERASRSAPIRRQLRASWSSRGDDNARKDYFGV